MESDIISGREFLSFLGRKSKERSQEGVLSYWTQYVSSVIEDACFYDLAIGNRVYLDPMDPRRQLLALMTEALVKNWGNEAFSEVEAQMTEFLRENGWMKVDPDDEIEDPDDEIEDPDDEFEVKGARDKKESRKKAKEDRCGIYLIPIESETQYEEEDV